MKYQEIKRDLFTVSNDYALAHCISADAVMGAGIAKEFRRRYPDMRRHVRRAHPKVGKVVGYKQGSNTIFNLVTKTAFYQKPSYESFTDAIISLRDECIKEGIKKLAIPLLGAGLDRLNWERNKGIIKCVFGNTDVEILVCKL